MSFTRIVGLTLFALSLAGCAAPSVHYYTLLPASVVPDAVSGLSPAAIAPYAIHVKSIELPAEVERPQIVFTRPESTELIPLGSAIWASPLADQIRVALTNQLAQQVHALDVASSVPLSKMPVWEINLRVHRFESLYQQRAVLDVSWHLNPINIPNATASLCGAQIQIPVQDSVGSMVEGHRLALYKLSALIAAQLKGQAYSDQSNQVYLKGCTYS